MPDRLHSFVRFIFVDVIDVFLELVAIAKSVPYTDSALAVVFIRYQVLTGDNSNLIYPCRTVQIDLTWHLLFDIDCCAGRGPTVKSLPSV